MNISLRSWRGFSSLGYYVCVRRFRVRWTTEWLHRRLAAPRLMPRPIIAHRQRHWRHNDVDNDVMISGRQRGGVVAFSLPILLSNFLNEFCPTNTNQLLLNGWIKVWKDGNAEERRLMADTYLLLTHCTIRFLFVNSLIDAVRRFRGRVPPI